MVNIQVRVDNSLRIQAQQIAKAMGIDLTTAIRMFLVQKVNDRALPFQPRIDLFYSKENQEHLQKALDDVNNNRNIVQHELIDG